MEIRPEVKLEMSVADLIVLMAEGNPGAITVMSKILQVCPSTGMFMLLHLDDMNIRGTQIWVAYKDYCNQDMGMFIQKITSRDPKMVEKVNAEGRRGNHKHMAVVGGASQPGARKLL